MPQYERDYATGTIYLSEQDDLFLARQYSNASLVGFSGNDEFSLFRGPQNYLFNTTFSGLDGNDRLDLSIDFGLGGRNTFYGGSGLDVLELNVGSRIVMEYAPIAPYDGSLGFQHTGTVNFPDFQTSIATFDVERFVIKGSDFNDVFRGGIGDDWFDGRGGLDQFYGSNGSDGYVFDTVGERVIGEQAGGGIDSIFTSVSVDLRDNANIENLRLSSGNINGTGNELANLITGSAGNNTIAGGVGTDSLYGKGGADIFAFSEMGVANKDSIWDFGSDDKIRLARGAFTGIDSNFDNLLDAGVFQIGSKATGTGAVVLYDKNSGNISYDDDGSGAHAAQAIAFIGKNLAFVDASDFLVA